MICWEMVIYKDAIDEIIGLPYGETIKIVFSVTNTGVKKAALKPIMLKKKKAWQCEKFIGGAAFHENIPDSGFRTYLERLLDENQFKQIHIITLDSVIAYRVTKKLALNRTKTTGKTDAKVSLHHDKAKDYLLVEGMPVQPLVDLGVFTQDFRIVKAKYYKFRQINSFLKIIDSFLRGDTGAALNIVEFGCGKSYLTFILYYYLTTIKNINARITGYDINSDVVEFCNGVARKYGYDNLNFIEGDVSKITVNNTGADMIITLHACNTATDHALYYAIQNKVKYIFCVPCCQHEINAQINRTDEYAILLRHGIFKERFSALLTDCIRCEVLSGMGYAVDVVEFVGEENTPKNTMIRAHYTGYRKNNGNEIRKLLSQFGAEHTLLKLVDCGHAEPRA